MSAFPLLQQGMLLMSLLMVGVTVWQMWRWRRFRAMKVLGAVSVVLTEPLGTMVAPTARR